MVTYQESLIFLIVKQVITQLSSILQTKKGTIQISEIAGFEKKHFPKDNKRFVHAKMIVACLAPMFGTSDLAFH